jgi:hypothetical protein
MNPVLIHRSLRVVPIELVMSNSVETFDHGVSPRDAFSTPGTVRDHWSFSPGWFGEGVMRSTYVRVLFCCCMLVREPAAILMPIPLVGVLVFLIPLAIKAVSGIWCYQRAPILSRGSHRMDAQHDLTAGQSC